MSRALKPLEWPLKMTCAVCGAESRAYPYPQPKGSVCCPNCSPAWLEPFLIFSCKKRGVRLVGVR